jgi:hypothetical protein
MQFYAVNKATRLSQQASVKTLAEPSGGTSDGRQALTEGAKDLLKHIPGEATGFYLLAAGALTSPEVSTLAVIFVLALVLLVVVRWAAGASPAVMATTIGAFLIWMFVIDQGVFHVAFPALLPVPMGLILALFYSGLITALAGAGKIQ